MPLRFWWNAFSTAVFLINRLPTQVLSHNSPYDLVYGHPPNFHFLKVFGCACFPFLRPYNQNKLQFRSAKCMFIGYSSKHKGYLCLHSTGKIYVAYDVLFNEEEFLFSSGFLSDPLVNNTLCVNKLNSLPITLQSQSWSVPIVPTSTSVPITSNLPLRSPVTNLSNGQHSESVSPIHSHSPPVYSSDQHLESTSPVHSQQFSSYTSAGQCSIPVSPIPPVLAMHRSCPESVHGMITRSKTGVFKPKCYNVSNVSTSQ